MGKGDQRTKRGKIIAGSFGKSRPKNKKKNASANGENKPEAKDKE